MFDINHQRKNESIKIVLIALMAKRPREKENYTICLANNSLHGDSFIFYTLMLTRINFNQILMQSSISMASYVDSESEKYSQRSEC